MQRSHDTCSICRFVWCDVTQWLKHILMSLYFKFHTASITLAWFEHSACFIYSMVLQMNGISITNKNKCFFFLHLLWHVWCTCKYCNGDMIGFKCTSFISITKNPDFNYVSLWTLKPELCVLRAQWPLQNHLVFYHLSFHHLTNWVFYLYEKDVISFF